MKNTIKVAFLTSIITAAMVYVLLEWKPLRSESSRPPEVSLASSRSASPASATAPAPADLSDEEKNNIDVYQRYSGGVVNITTTALTYDFFFRPVPTEAGTGSGAVIDDKGHIVTNYHVIRDAERMEVTLPDKTKLEAKLVGFDPNKDLAVIQINVPRGARLTPIPIGTSKGLLVGQKVLAIGNPFGLERTLTTGIISSLGRSIQAPNGLIIDDIIQTDAPINPGNSGGPLLNSAGQIVGINTAILSPSNSGSIGIGFAIPADTVRQITSELITSGYVRYPWIGLGRVLPLADYPAVANALQLNVQGGLMVVDTYENSPAAKAGIRESTQQLRTRYLRLPVGGDVILKIQGKAVNTPQEIQTEIYRYKPGDRITVTVVRNNKEMDLPVTLEEFPRK
jgi:S1-C subfamily serine protease